MLMTLTLNPAIDYLITVPEISLEDTLRAKTVLFQPGGKGVNVSRVLHRLGVENIASGFCGGDTGQWLRSFLDDEGVSHDFVAVESQTRVNTIITEQHERGQLRISAPGGRIRNDEWHLLCERLRNLPGDIRWVTLGGNVPPPLEASALRELLELLNTRGVSTVVDADGAVLQEALAASPFLIKPNRYELERLTGRSMATLDDVVGASRSLIQAGKTQAVVTSLAEAGAVLVTDDEVLTAKAPEVDVMSKVGAGDSMVAGVLKALCEEAPWEEVLRMGVAAGTATVMNPANYLLQAYQYEDLLAQVEVTPWIPA